VALAKHSRLTDRIFRIQLYGHLDHGLEVHVVPIWVTDLMNECIVSRIAKPSTPHRLELIIGQREHDIVSFFASLNLLESNNIFIDCFGEGLVRVSLE
jgi:hypothetical protein